MHMNVNSIMSPTNPRTDTEKEKLLYNITITPQFTKYLSSENEIKKFTLEHYNF